jgi:hypothetical protein
MDGPVSGKQAEFGVLFVEGIGGQRPGSAVASLGAALFRWLLRWNRAECLTSQEAPVLGKTLLCAGESGSAEPAYLMLEVPLRLSGGDRSARWLLAESSWADAHAPLRFLELGLWIWKVSTCLLVLQFVIPMRRHWRRHKCDGVAWWRRPGSAVVSLCYLALMAVGAMSSVLLALVLLGLAAAALLPIPRIDGAVKWAVVRLSAILGDSYLLAHCPVQLAAMRSKVADDLRWLQGRCDVVAVVAHSQGAALAHQVLSGAGPASGVRAFITFGQGISKLHLLQRMDWERFGRRAARRSRSFVVTGLLLAGLPAVGWLAGRLGIQGMRVLDAGGLYPLLIVVGFGSLVSGVWQAVHANARAVDGSLALPSTVRHLAWSDYYASADPVSNGRIDPEQAAASKDRGPRHPVHGLPRRCREVYNHGSLITDHNSYLRNQDQFLPWLLNDLVAAAYGHNRSRPHPRLVREKDIKKVTRRRRWLIDWLIFVRVLTLAAGVALWHATAGTSLASPLNQAMHMAGPHISVGNLAARLAGVILAMIGAYLIAGVIPWRIMENRVCQDFFENAMRYGDPSPTPEQANAALPKSPIWRALLRRRQLTAQS